MCVCKLKQKLSKVSWNTVCLPKDQGGLDFKDTKAWNKAQLMYHLWQVIRYKSSSLWARWIHSTVLKSRPFWGIQIPSDCSWIWRKILSLRDEAKSFIQYSIGNGNRTSLWYDPWYKKHCLSQYPASQMILQSGIPADAKVSEIISHNEWSLPILNQVHHSDHDLINWICHFDHNTPKNPATEDSINWNGTLEGKVSARTIWLDIRKTSGIVPWHPIVWNRMAISRFAFTTWIAMHGRLPTLERLLAFGIHSNMKCSLCIDAVENQHHLFISCHYSRFVLTKLFNLITMYPVPDAWDDMITFLLALIKPHRDIAFLAFQIFVYHIWRERNYRMHDRGMFNPHKLLKGIILDLRTRASSSAWFIKQTTKYPLLQKWLL